MGYAVYQVGPRYGGYGVPAYCEQPECTEEIDRGMSYACGGEPFSEYGCDRYFCEKHRDTVCVTALIDELHDCEIDQEEDCELRELCERCKVSDASFPYKPEHPTWVTHLLTDESWEEWRMNNATKVQELKALSPE